MKSGTAGVASGCVIWAIVFGILATCLGSTAMLIGSLTFGTDLAVRTVGPLVCPDNTTAQINTYETTTTDDNGFESPATGYEMQCRDKNNSVVKTDSIGFSFYWMGILVAAGAILAALLSFLVAGPAGVLIARLIKKNREPNAA
jgi:hypothetical protein